MTHRLGGMAYVLPPKLKETVGWFAMPVQPPEMLYSPAAAQYTAPGMRCGQKFKDLSLHS